jgi:hypothetical protein
VVLVLLLLLQALAFQELVEVEVEDTKLAFQAVQETLAQELVEMLMETDLMPQQILALQVEVQVLEVW